jgi:hypothetical protein
MSEVTADDPAGLPTLEDCTDNYDDTEVSVPLSYVALSSSLTPGSELSQFRVADSACSINLTAFRGDFVTFTHPPLPLAWVGSVSTLRALAMCGSLLDLPPPTIFTAQYTHCTPPTCPLALLSASASSLVSARCSPKAVVNSSSPVTMTLIFLWYPQEWVC